MNLTVHRGFAPAQYVTGVIKVYVNRHAERLENHLNSQLSRRNIELNLRGANLKLS